jgi:hypothetical protein
MTITDEQLSAFIDGELSPVVMKEIAAAIDSDPKLKRRVEGLAASDAILKHAYSAIDDTPMPAAVTALLAEPASTTGNVFALKRPAPLARWSMPLVASIALGAGFALGLMIVEPGRMAPSGGLMIAAAISPADALHAALDQTPSGETTTIKGGREAAMILTFMSSGGDYCREFTLEVETNKSRAIACREDGRWSVKLAAAESGVGSGYVTAASAVSTAFDAGAETLGAGKPLDRATEQELLQKKWRTGNQ